MLTYRGGVGCQSPRNLNWSEMFMLAVSHNSNPSVNDIKRWNTEKKPKIFFNQIANTKKRAKLARFAKGIVDDWSSTRHTDQISRPFLTFSSVAEKYWPLSRGYFGSWERAAVAVHVVERWPRFECIIVERLRTFDCIFIQNQRITINSSMTYSVIKRILFAGS